MSTATSADVSSLEQLLQLRQRTPERRVYLVPLICDGQHWPAPCVPQEVVDPASGLLRVLARPGTASLRGEWTLTDADGTVAVSVVGVAVGQNGSVRDRFQINGGSRVLRPGDTLTVTVPLV